LEAEQRYALYFLLEYLTTKGVPLHQLSWALQYLEKAAMYFGMTKRQIEELKPFYNTYEKITSYIKQIKNRQILEYMISNCSNIFLLMDVCDEHRRLGEQAYKLYEELGFPYDEVRYIVHKYMYRTDI
jgi:arginine deiminase